MKFRTKKTVLFERASKRGSCREKIRYILHFLFEQNLDRVENASQAAENVNSVCGPDTVTANYARFNRRIIQVITMSKRHLHCKTTCQKCRQNHGVSQKPRRCCSHNPLLNLRIPEEDWKKAWRHKNLLNQIFICASLQNCWIVTGDEK